MDMKKLLAVSLTIMILGTLGGCGKQDTQEPPKVEIDYGNSELYTPVSYTHLTLPTKA